MAFVRKPGLYVIFYTGSRALSACSERYRPAIVLRITRDIRSVPDRVKRLLFSCPGLSGLMQVYTPPGRPATEIRISPDTNVITWGYPGLSLKPRITGDLSFF